MKKLLSMLIIAALLLPCLAGCGDSTLLDPSDPVVLTIWHTYGEQTDSPMNRLISEFNSTVGRECGIIINVSLVTVAAKIGERLNEAMSDAPGSLEMPDLFFCHNNDAAAVGTDLLVDWNDLFTAAEIDDFLPDFVADGIVDDKLVVLPVSKSTHILYMTGGEFDRFSAATGVTYQSLSTWDGFFDAAARYYEYSDGKPFCALDYLMRAVELYAASNGADINDFYKDGWYDTANEALRASYLKFAEAIARGHIVVADLYANTQIMTGETPAGIGSSAGILYYNDIVTYPDNTSEPMDLRVLPLPYATEAKKLDTQAGVGLCAIKTTEAKAEAASVFAHWLVEGERNLNFVADTGYMPVTADAYEALDSYEFDKESYRRLYSALNTIKSDYTLLREPAYVGYYDKINQLYDSLRQSQGRLPGRVAAGESLEALADELWKLLAAIK